MPLYGIDLETAYKAELYKKEHSSIGVSHVF